MGFISTHTIEETFRRLFKEKGRASRIEVIEHQVEQEEARWSSGALAGHLNDSSRIIHEAGLAFDLFCHDRVSKGLIYPESWRLFLEQGLELDEEFWFLSDEGPMFEGKGDKAAAERVLSAAPSALPPWHGKEPKEIAENHDWTVCLKLLASTQYLFDLEHLIVEINQSPNSEGSTFIANSCYSDNVPPLGGFDL
jgi:hypothetical protein